jgi:hypothetical protein
LYKNIWIKYKNKIFDVDKGVDNVDNFVDKMWISVDGRMGNLRGLLKNAENTSESGELRVLRI